MHIRHECSGLPYYIHGKRTVLIVLDDAENAVELTWEHERKGGRNRNTIPLDHFQHLVTKTVKEVPPGTDRYDEPALESRSQEQRAYLGAYWRNNTVLWFRFQAEGSRPEIEVPAAWRDCEELWQDYQTAKSR